MFRRLVRFVADDGKIYTGDAGEGTDLTCARIILGDIFGNYKVTDEKLKIEKILPPLSQQQLRTIRGIGFNYVGLPEALGVPYPKYPLLFYKPLTSIIGHLDDINIAPSAQDPGLDAEAELVIVIGKEGFRIPKDNALDYVLGYTVGNDVTHLGWMKRGNMTGSIGKEHDGWGPIGPAIISRHEVEDVQDLYLWSKVNGKLIQSGSSKEMIFSVSELICFLSQGTTLLPGDIIFSGTPLGVRSVQNPPVFLNDGDIVEVGIRNIGSITNKIAFVRE